MLQGKVGEELTYAAQRHDSGPNTQGMKADLLFRHGDDRSEPVNYNKASIQSLAYGGAKGGNMLSCLLQPAPCQTLFTFWGALVP